MNKEVIETLKNKTVRDSITNSLIDETYFVTEKRQYTLKECLENIDEKILNHIYITIQLVSNKDIDYKKTNKEIIKLLEKEIVKQFKSYLSRMKFDEKILIRDIIQNNNTQVFKREMLSCG